MKQGHSTWRCHWTRGGQFFKLFSKAYNNICDQQRIAMGKNGFQEENDAVDIGTTLDNLIMKGTTDQDINARRFMSNNKLAHSNRIFSVQLSELTTELKMYINIIQDMAI